MAKGTSERSETIDQVANGLTRALADYGSGLRFEDIPENVRTIGKHCVLDWRCA